MPRFLSISLVCTALALPALTQVGCSSARIAMGEQFGYAKREQLVDRVEDARAAQTEAKQEFRDALAEFVSVTGITPEGYEAKYDQLRKAHKDSEDSAEKVSSRIKSVERVADALFKEWDKELAQFQSESLRKSSEEQLTRTRASYTTMLSAMKSAEERMTQVLGRFNDQVLIMKHNLNARAVSALTGTVKEIESDVEKLVKEMEASIAEADAFIKQMQGT